MAKDMRVSGRILDASALKALAHPLRFQLIELLLEHGPSTASGLGRLVGESSGLTSYHLRELAKHDLIEEAAELGSARDRWWRAREGGYTLDGFEMLQQDSTRQAAQFLLDEVMRARFERLQRWHRDAPEWGEHWVAATAEVTARLHLSRDELAELTREVIAVVDRYRDMQAGRIDAEPTATDDVPVTIQFDAFPTGEPRANAVDPNSGR